jgi:hypothetical protein
MGRRGAIPLGRETPVKGADVHLGEFTAGSGRDVGAYPLPSRAAIAGVAADVDSRSDGSETSENEESELHCGLSKDWGWKLKDCVVD